jgi:hypothetical protein
VIFLSLAGAAATACYLMVYLEELREWRAEPETESLVAWMEGLKE